MNYNILTYCIYLAICFTLTVFVGKSLHRNGYYLILDLFGHPLFTKTVNNLLLIAYYLVNLGYIALTLIQFGVVTNIAAVLVILSQKVGLILLILSALHFNNIFILYLLSKRKYKIITFFNP